MTHELLGAEELPLLGEPLPVELANSLYQGSDGQCFDFLGPEYAASWLAHGPIDARPTPAALGDLRLLRDHVRAIVRAAVAGESPRPQSLRAIERAAATCPRKPRLELAGDQPQVHWQRIGSRLERELAEIAEATIELMVGPSWAALRECAADDCTMLFVQHHRRRRFCHASCSHRMRQLSYLARRRQAGA